MNWWLRNKGGVFTVQEVYWIAGYISYWAHNISSCNNKKSDNGIQKNWRIKLFYYKWF